MSKKRTFYGEVLGTVFACGLVLSPAHAQDIATVAGGGPVGTRPALAVGLTPSGVVVTAGGTTYISGSHRVFVLDSSGNLTVVAGNGGVGSSGDGGPAIAAAVNPTRLGVDGAGNVYFSDFDGHRVRRIDASTGIVSTVAGNGVRAYGGDGGPAAAASLNNPMGLAVDASGNMFIADRGNYRVRRVDAATGIITTAAGNGPTGGPLGDGGPATSAFLSSPSGIAVDAGGNLFVSEGPRVRRVDAATGIISTYVGGFNFPDGLALDGSGNLFMADSGNQRIRRVEAVTKTITTVAGNGSAGFAGDGGPAVEASLFYPSGVAVNAAGDILIVDGFNRVRRVDASTGLISSIAGNGSLGFDGDGRPATETSFALPWGTAVDSLGNLYVADHGNHRVRRVDATTGLVTTFAGDGTSGFGGDGGPAVSAKLAAPIAVAVDTTDNVYIADANNQRIRRVDAATGVIATVVGGGSLQPYGVPATSALLSWPQGVAIDGTGNLFIADFLRAIVFRVDAATGLIDRFAGVGSPGFAGDGGPAISAWLDGPTEVALDPVGNVFIADRNNHRIRRVDGNTGIMTTIAGDGFARFAGDGGPATSASLNFPPGVAVDAFGNVFIADPNAHRIRRVGANGIITTLAGTGVFGFGGDEGAAVLAELGGPAKVRVDPAGNLLISDTSNGRIRTVTLSTDLSITLDDGVSVVTAGQVLVYSIVVHNNSAAAVTATVTDTLPPTLTAGSWTCAASSGGSCGAGGSGNIQDSAHLPGGGTATYTLQATVVGYTGVTNTASVMPSEPFVEAMPANNAATDTDGLVLVLISAFDGTIILSNGKAAEMMLPVRLSRPSDVPVSVAYHTADGTATAGWDYDPAAGVLTFNPGTTAIDVPVTVKATGPPGSARTFFLNLSASSGAPIEDGQSQATVIRGDN